MWLFSYLHMGEIVSGLTVGWIGYHQTTLLKSKGRERETAGLPQLKLTEERCLTALDADLMNSRIEIESNRGQGHKVRYRRDREFREREPALRFDLTLQYPFYPRTTYSITVLTYVPLSLMLLLE